MEILFATSRELINRVSTAFVREKHDEKLFIYHKYIQQLDAEALQYCMDIVTIGQYPVVCLMNDYSLKTGKPSEELLSFVSESFEQYNVNQ